RVPSPAHATPKPWPARWLTPSRRATSRQAPAGSRAGAWRWPPRVTKVASRPIAPEETSHDRHRPGRAVLAAAGRPGSGADVAAAPALPPPDHAAADRHHRAATPASGLGP